MGVQTRGSHWPLVGREAELDAFETAWANPRCRGWMIFGSAGAGKSRLAEECLARTVRKGWKSGRATASAAAAAVPLSAIAHLIPSGIDLSDPVKGFAAVDQALAGPGRRRKWVIWVDDLHLLDATSVVLLRQLMDAGVVWLIGTVRTESPVSEVVQALTGGGAVQRLDLPEFQLDQAQRLLSTALGCNVSLSTLHRLYEVSGGNVLYLQELVTGALQSGALVRNGEIWEISQDRLLSTPLLTDLISGRLAAAPAVARPVLELLALCEQLPLADLDAPLDALADLESAGLLRVHLEGRRTTVTLAHSLYGETLRAGMTAQKRQDLLLAQIRRVEDRGVRRHDDPLHIATWGLSATGTADSDLLVRAIGLAHHSHDYERVVNLTSALGEEHQNTDIRLMLGLACRGLGDFDRSEVVLADAYRHAVDEKERVAAVMLRTLNLYWAGARVEETQEVDSIAREHVTSSAGRHMLDINQAAMLTVSGQPERGLTILRDVSAKDIHSTLDVNVLLYGMGMKTVGLTLVGRTAEAISAGQEAYEAHVNANQRAFMPHPSTQLVHLALALTESGQLRKAYDVAYRAFFELQGETVACLLAAGQLGRIELLRGHAASARHWYAEAAAIARSVGSAALKSALSGLAAAASLTGDTEGAKSALVEAEGIESTAYLAGQEICLGEAGLMVALGNTTEARELLLAEAARMRASGQLTTEAWLLTEAARLRGSKELADRLVELAEICDGTLILARAHFVGALADRNAPRLLASADEFEVIGADLLAAEAVTAAAHIWRKAGETRQATAATRRAAACMARCEGAQSYLLAAAEDTAALTSREREVAMLAMRGTSSRDIATALHLSVRTIDNHLQSVYLKLGVTSRRQLSGYMETIGTAPRPH
ncbi:LuxR family transcriptional regulator [Streptomyces sp. RKAG293]|uniref:LuxR C-terminal-related transcriptional regulator n=1 Tax=Streptomyces sp. RKAG293 TaxID=2893403 RepID=UPI0020339F59|nr:LuxR family transcriptional regulator [Streptomyces sp. RKAG293]MCM2416571.1 LuxR C-terminal-related transcriptional regulator [Streptomyces sp. RKAG293]